MLERWENQRFLGRPATYGDDRSLTNFVLRNWKVNYDELARSRTIVPTHFRVFLRQQLRWKRSWTRESLIVGRFIWRKQPAREPVGLPRDLPAAGRADRRGARDRLAAAGRRAPARRSST